MREQTGALAPPSFDANRIRQVQKGGMFSGKNSRAYKMPEVNYELSLEMNKKMQSVLEDTLLKNITLKVRKKFLSIPKMTSTFPLCRKILILWAGRSREYQLSCRPTKRSSGNSSSTLISCFIKPCSQSLGMGLLFHLIIIDTMLHCIRGVFPLRAAQSTSRV